MGEKKTRTQNWSPYWCNCRPDGYTGLKDVADDAEDAADDAMVEGPEAGAECHAE